MKASIFNIIEPINNGILLYNTNSNSILKLNNEYTTKYLHFQKTNELTDPSLKAALIKGKMIFNEGVISEVDQLLLENTLSRFSGNSIGLTIAPTMKCNFRCPYCYEKGRNLATMSIETIQKTKNFISSLKKTYNNLSVTWYGGEPLLALPIIKELMELSIKVFGSQNVHSSLISNGYLMTQQSVKTMKELSIDHIQITIDGPPEIHNQRRCLPNKSDTFFVILENIRSALKIYSELKISIRVNIDKTNVENIDEIIHYLRNYELLNKVNLYIAPVSNINNTCNSSTCFSVQEFALEQLDFMKRNEGKGCSFVSLPSRNTFMCGAVSVNSWLIDANGDLYKCWDDVGDLSETIGNLREIDSAQLYSNPNLIKWLNYSIKEDKECMTCPYLPLCMGGCPNYRLKKSKKNCNPIKENAKQLVHLIYDIEQKKGQANV